MSADAMKKRLAGHWPQPSHVLPVRKEVVMGVFSLKTIAVRRAGTGCRRFHACQSGSRFDPKGSRH